MKTSKRIVLRRAIFLLVLLVSLYSLFTPSPPSHELLATKNGWLNRILAKYAFAWSFLPSLPLILLIKPIRIERWLAGSLLWIILTQYFFGHDLTFLMFLLVTQSSTEFKSLPALVPDPTNTHSKSVQGEIGLDSTSVDTRFY
jgi:hypothetical protein